MGVEQIEANALKEKITQGSLVVVDFYADWCGPCKQLSPILEEVASSDIGEVKIYKIDIDNDVNRDFVQENNILSIPTVFFYKNGQVVHQFVGVQNKDSILQLINAHK